MGVAKIRIYPDQKSLIVLNNYFGSYRYVYNKAIDHTNKKYDKKKKEFDNKVNCLKCDQPKVDDLYFCKKHKNSKVIWDLGCSFISLRNKVCPKEDNLEEKEKWLLNTPFNTRQLAVKEASKNILTNMKNKAKNIIGAFKMKFKSRKNKTQCCEMDASSLLYDKMCIGGHLNNKINFNIKKGYMKYWNKIKNKVNNDNMKKRDYKLISYGPGQYYLLIPKESEIKPTTVYKRGIGVFDPGVRTFLTGLSTLGDNKVDGFIKLGDNYVGRTNKYYNKIDKLQELITKNTGRTKYNMIRRMQKSRTKISSIVSDLHRYAASWLTRTHDILVIPRLQTKQMVQTGLNKKTKRNMLMLSHGKFMDYLQFKCDLMGTKLLVPGEAYTSKTCSSCGILDTNLGAAKVFNCSTCHLRCCRDLNGAKNILLKSLGSILAH